MLSEYVAVYFQMQMNQSCVKFTKLELMSSLLRVFAVYVCFRDEWLQHKAIYFYFQVLFKPLLKAIGLQMEAVKMSAMMKKFGGNISVRSHLQTLRIEIVDSESGTMRKPKGKGKGRLKKTPKFVIDTGLDKPAFQTDALAFMVDMKDIVDFEKSKEEKKQEAEFMEMRRRSLRTLRFAMDHLEAKPTTMRVNCSFNCNAVTQHINMSLLRLIHQFVTMIENIHETRSELKERHTHRYTQHKKQDSKGSSTETGTDIHSIDPLDDDHVQVSEPSVSMQSPMSSELHSPTQRPSNLPLSDPPSDRRPRPDKLPISGGFTTKTPRKLSGKKAKLDSTSSKQSSTDPKTDEMLNSPIHSIDSVTIDMADTSSPALAEKTIVDQIRENTPLCWIKLYHILNLYSTMPDMKTVTKKPSQSRLSVIAEESEKGSQNQSVKQEQDPLASKAHGDDIEAVERQPKKLVAGKMYPKSTFTHSKYFILWWYSSGVTYLFYSMKPVFKGHSDERTPSDQGMFSQNGDCIKGISVM